VPQEVTSAVQKNHMENNKNYELNLPANFIFSAF
jgi:hypothetical protein